MFKKLFSIILTLAMLTSVFAVSASAKVFREESFNPYRANIWNSDGSRSYGVIPEDYVPYVEKDEEFAARKSEIEYWLKDECPVLFTFEGEATYSGDDDTVPVPGNYWLYNTFHGDYIHDFAGLDTAYTIAVDNYIHLLSLKSTNSTVADLDKWKADVQKILDEESDIPRADVEAIINAVDTDLTYYFDGTPVLNFKKAADECLAKIDPKTDTVDINSYWKLYIAFRDVCVSNKLMGDVSMDGEVTATDATMVLQAFANITDFNVSQKTVINNEITADMATKILQDFCGVVEDLDCRIDCYETPCILLK